MAAGGTAAGAMAGAEEMITAAAVVAVGGTDAVAAASAGRAMAGLFLGITTAEVGIIIAGGERVGTATAANRMRPEAAGEGEAATRTSHHPSARAAEMEGAEAGGSSDLLAADGRKKRI